jgi:hypothetical protein
LGENPERPNGEFVEVSRPEAADPVTEFSVLQFINGDKTLPDWSASLANLKELGKDRVYTMGMMKACLLRLVNRFISNQSKLLQEKTANEIAKMLLNMDPHVDKISHYRQALFAACRLPGEDLPPAMTRFENLLNQVYPAAKAANAAIRIENRQTN